MSSFTKPEGVAMMLLAGLCDMVSITATFVIGIIPCLIIDFLCLMIVGAWMYSRSSDSEAARPDRRTAKTKLKTEGKVEIKQAEKQAAKQIEKTAVKRTSRKIALRAGGAFLGTLVPVIQLIPFWTITVVGELKE